MKEKRSRVGSFYSNTLRNWLKRRESARLKKESKETTGDEKKGGRYIKT